MPNVSETAVRAAAFAALLVASLGAASAHAHKPSFGEEGFTGPDDAFQVEDPAVSIVVYRSVTCDQPQLWMELQGVDGFELFLQLLIPRIDRLADYRPSMALVGPGLPAPPDDLGSAIPEGLGATVFRTEGVEPVAFDEPFTMTQDWILVEETLVLPQPGTFYVVAWHPDGRTGKLAVAVGTLEQFGFDDFGRLAEWTELNQTFHETPSYPPETEPLDVVCGEAALEAGDAPRSLTNTGASSSGGCSVGAADASRASAAWLPWLVALLALPRRRRASAPPKPGRAR